MFVSDSEGTARKSAALRLATLLVPILDRYDTPSRSEIARRLGVRPSAITQALNPAKYDTALPLLERIADELGYVATITYKVDATVRLKRVPPSLQESGRRVADVMEGVLGG